MFQKIGGNSITGKGMSYTSESLAEGPSPKPNGQEQNQAQETITHPISFAVSKDSPVCVAQLQSHVKPSQSAV